MGMGNVSWPAGRQARRLVWSAVAAVGLVAAVVIGVTVFQPASHPAVSAPTQAPQSRAVHATPTRSASQTAATWQVASPVADLSEPLPGMPPVANPANIYADAGADMLTPATRGVPYRIYVPDSGGSTVTVINPATHKVIGTYQTGLNPQHVVPGYGM